MDGKKAKETTKNWLIAGKLVGNYVIDARLAASGRGEVYLAKDRTTKRVVALKILPAPPNCDRAQLAALAQELLNQALPHHPAICEIYEAGVTDDGKLFVVTEYVGGQSLETLVAAGYDFELEKIAEQIAVALQAAHAEGQVHADLKLSDVMLTPCGGVKILDFGLAPYKQLWRVSGKDELPQGDVPPSHLRHLAPERVHGLPGTPQSDLFSLGTMMYEMLTGAAAFHGATPLKVCAAIIWDKPQPIIDYAPSASSALCASIGKLMAKDEDKRTTSATELALEMRQLVADARQVKHPVAHFLQTHLSMQPLLVTEEGRMVLDFSRGVAQFFLNDIAAFICLSMALLGGVYTLASYLAIFGKH